LLLLQVTGTRFVGWSNQNGDRTWMLDDATAARKVNILTCFLTLRCTAARRALEHTNCSLPPDTALRGTLAWSHKDNLISASIFNTTE